MITNVTIQEFKSLENIQALELGRVNVFIGANGSGKTNLLEAIGFLGAAAGGFVDDQALLRRGVRPSAPALYSSSFKERKASDTISMSVTWSNAPSPLEYQAEFAGVSDARQQPWFYTAKLKSNGSEKVFTPTAGSFIPRESPLAKEMLSILSDYAVFSPNTPTLRGAEPDITQRSPVGLAGGQLAEAVSELLDLKRKTFGPINLSELFRLLEWVDEINVVPPSRQIVSPSVPTMRNIIRFTDRWMAKGRNQISAYDASEGALYVLFALVLALHPKSPRLFAIENLDQAMHPRLARASIRLFCQQLLKVQPESQVLLTTHNPLVLDGLDLRNDDIRLFTVERSAQGATRIDRVVVSDQILEATEEGLSLSNLWNMGRLGGAPDIF